MDSNIFPNIWRFIGLVTVQVLLLQQIGKSVGPYFNVLLYPLFILFLPFRLATPYLVLLGFAIGLVVDFFYPSIGTHASAGAFVGFMRPFVLAAFEPRAKYSGKEPIASPAHLGWQLFFQIAIAFFALHLFWYFSVNAFTFVYITTITLKTLAALGLTMIFVVLYCILFNPKS